MNCPICKNDIKGSSCERCEVDLTLWLATKERSKDLYQKGVRQFEKGNWLEAIDLLKDAVELDATNQEAQILFKETCMRLEKRVKKPRTLRGIYIALTLTVGMFLLGKYFINNSPKEPMESRAEAPYTMAKIPANDREGLRWPQFIKLRRLQNALIKYNYNLAQEFLNLGDYRKALTLFERVNPFPRTSIFDDDALYYQALCLQKLGRLKEAIKRYNDLIIMYPKSYYVDDALRELIVCYGKLG